jgi:hypothetical protein
MDGMAKKTNFSYVEGTSIIEFGKFHTRLPKKKFISRVSQ